MSDDGRSARRDRNRTAVLDAVLELYAEGKLVPGAPEVAERSGVSLRSLYRYFDDADELVRAAIARHLERLAPLEVIPAIGQGPLEDRIESMVRHRLALYAAAAPVFRVSRARAAVAPLLAEQLERRRRQLRGQVEEQFEPELASMAGADRRAVTAAVDALLQFDGLELLCHDQGLSSAVVGDVLRRALHRLLA